MNRIGCIVLWLAAAGLAFGADAAEPVVQVLQVKELPSEKTPDLLTTRERNPFIRRENKAAEVLVETESEESKLRALLQTMTVTGVIRGEGGAKALLQNMILKEGIALPPLFPGQVEQLVVASIGDRQIELHFVEADANAKPRKILIPIEMRPRKTGQIISVPIAPPAKGDEESVSNPEPVAAP